LQEGKRDCKKDKRDCDSLKAREITRELVCIWTALDNVSLSLSLSVYYLLHTYINIYIYMIAVVVVVVVSASRGNKERRSDVTAQSLNSSSRGRNMRQGCSFTTKPLGFAWQVGNVHSGRVHGPSVDELLS
jgi:hypothetical protein